MSTAFTLVYDRDGLPLNVGKKNIFDTISNKDSYLFFDNAIHTKLILNRGYRLLVFMWRFYNFRLWNNRSSNQYFEIASTNILDP